MRSRAWRRSQRRRVIAARQRRHRLLTGDYSWSYRLPDGRLADTDAYLDCGRTRCGMCHFDKFYARAPRRVDLAVRSELAAEGL